MKTRIGFVSNSSSSSFLIDKKNLTPTQLEQIRDYLTWGNKLKISDELLTEYDWEIAETKDMVIGSAAFETFDMEYFLDIIGIDYNKVRWHFIM